MRRLAASLAVGSLALYAAALLRWARIPELKFLGRPEPLLYAAATALFLGAFLWIAWPAIAFNVARRRGGWTRRTLPMEHAPSATVRLYVKYEKEKTKTHWGPPGLSLAPGALCRMPDICACCGSAERLSTHVVGTWVLRYLLPVPHPNPYAQRSRRYMRFAVPYCERCLLHVRAGRLRPYLAVFVTALLLPIFDLLCEVLGLGARGRSPAVPLAVWTAIVAPVFFTLGLLYLLASRLGFGAPTTGYHRAGAIIGACFLGLIFLPLGLAVPVAFGLALLAPRALDLRTSSEACTHWADGRAVDCRFSPGWGKTGDDVEPRSIVFRCARGEFAASIVAQ